MLLGRPGLGDHPRHISGADPGPPGQADHPRGDQRRYRGCGGDDHQELDAGGASGLPERDPIALALSLIHI